MKTKFFVTAGLTAAMTLAAPLAHSAFVIGNASTIGFFENNTSALGVPTSLVSTLTIFDVASLMTVGAASGDLVPAGAGTAFDFTFLTVPQAVYNFNGFDFEVLEWGPVNPTGFSCSDGKCTDGIGFSGTGSVTGNTFQATEFTMSWSAQGSCNENPQQLGQCGADATASWSASISATGQQAGTIPEPATLALVGFALAGMGLSRRPRV